MKLKKIIAIGILIMFGIVLVVMVSNEPDNDTIVDDDIDTTIDKATEYSFVYSWNLDQSSNPVAIAINSYEVYVLDYENNLIQRFTKDGRSYFEWSIRQEGLSFPLDMAIDSDNNIYVLDDDDIFKFTEYFDNVTRLNLPEKEITSNNELVIDSENNVYVFGNDMLKFDSKGSLIKEWSLPTYDFGRYGIAYSFDVDSNDNVYVLYGFGIDKYDKNGNMKEHIDYTPAEKISLSYGDKISIDTQDNIFILDQTNEMIHMILNNGTHITSWGYSGYDKGEFFGIDDMEFNSQNIAYVLDSENKRIQVFMDRFLLPQPPLKQVKSGIALQNVECKIGKTLVQKAINGSPACVYFTSVDKLVERLWTISDVTPSK